MRHAVLPWIAGGLLLIGASVGGIALANATVFGAEGFLRVYLDAVARGDATAAAEVPGVSTGSLDRSTVDGAAMPGVSDVRVTSDRETAPGRYAITVAWTSGGMSGSTSFDIERSGTRLLLFPAWRFATPPVAQLDVTPRGDTRFRLGRLDAVGAGERTFALLVPGQYRVELDGPIAASAPVAVEVDRAGVRVTATPQARATSSFATAVGRAVRSAVTACTSQRVLYPSGCPFGAGVTDRITTRPTWSIAVYPDVRVTPTDRPGVWLASLSGGSATGRVEVRSLYDGSVKEAELASSIRGVYRVVVEDDRPVLAGLTVASESG